MAKDLPDLFDDAVFEAFKTSSNGQRTASVRLTSAAEFADVAAGNTTLRFTTLQRKASDVQITRTETGGYRIAASGMHRKSFDLSNWIKADNQVDVTFSDDLLNFEPEQGLVMKSKVPLWVVRPMGAGSVSIERVWSKD